MKKRVLNVYHRWIVRALWLTATIHVNKTLLCFQLQASPGVRFADPWTTVFIASLGTGIKPSGMDPPESEDFTLAHRWGQCDLGLSPFSNHLQIRGEGNNPRKNRLLWRWCFSLSPNSPKSTFNFFFFLNLVWRYLIEKLDVLGIYCWCCKCKVFLMHSDFTSVWYSTWITSHRFSLWCPTRCALPSACSFCMVWIFFCVFILWRIWWKNLNVLIA